MKNRPTPDEVAQVKAEGRQQPGWLRSHFMHHPWPRPGVAPCGRSVCPICGEAPMPFHRAEMVRMDTSAQKTREAVEKEESAR